MTYNFKEPTNRSHPILLYSANAALVLFGIILIVNFFPNQQIRETRIDLANTEFVSVRLFVFAIFFVFLAHPKMCERHVDLADEALGLKVRN